MLADILEKARENGFDFTKKPRNERNYDLGNLTALAKTLEHYIDSLGGVMPKSTVNGGSDEQKVFFGYVNLLASRASDYGLNALEVREALAMEHDVPAASVSVRGAGVSGYVFYKDDLNLSGYLRQWFSEPQTVHVFEMR